MLTAFTARPIVELRARDKSRVQSLVAYGDRLLVGLHTGVLRIYRVNEADPTATATAASPTTSTSMTAAKDSAVANPPTILLREVEKFASRSIEQLAIIKEANTLVSLANYAVSLHDLQTFTPLPGAAPLPGTKNASAFAVTSNIVKDPATGIPEIVSRLAVAVKRRLLLWTWYASELSTGDDRTDDGRSNVAAGRPPPPPEITLPETIRSLTWASATKLVVGMNAGYVLVDVLARTFEDIAGGGNSASNNGSLNGNGHGNANGGSSDFAASTSRFGALSSAGMGYMGLGSYMPRPLAAKLADGAVLLAKDVHTIFVSDQGRTLDRRPIPWTGAPDSIGYSYPYILALRPPGSEAASGNSNSNSTSNSNNNNGSKDGSSSIVPGPPPAGVLEIRNPDTLSLLQTIPLPAPVVGNAGTLQLHVPPPSVSLAHAGKGFHVASERGVWKMDATGYDSQVDALVACGRLDEAISLLGLLEDALLRDKAQTLRAVKMRKAEQLFRQRRYLDSMDLFSEEDVHAPPERVLRFFPRSIVGELSDEVLEEKKDETEEVAVEDDNEGDASAAGSSPEADAAKDTTAEAAGISGKETDGSESREQAPQPSEQQQQPPQLPSLPPLPAEVALSLPKASGFTKMFMSHRRTDSDAASTRTNTSSVAKGPTAAVATAAEEAGDAEKPATANGYVSLEGKDLMRAVEALNSYLAGARARLQREIDPATGKLKEKKAASGDKNRRTEKDEDEDEDDEAREKRLREAFTLVDTTMFRVLMLIRPKLASSLFRIPNFCDPAVVNERLLERSRFNELVDFFYGKRLHRRALELLREFGEGCEEDREKERERESESESKIVVPPALRGPRRTVAYLQSLPPEMADLVLEFSAWTLRADPELGMEVFLADSENAESLPRDRVAGFLAEIDARLEIRYLDHVINELNDLTPAFHNRLVDQRIRLLQETDRGSDDSGSDSDDSDAKARRADWDTAMAKLVAFLKTSRQYSLSRVFGLIPRDDAAFYKAQAIVLSKMGQHKQALEIYVFKMKDEVEAEEYCNRIHAAREAARSAAQAAQPVSPRLGAATGTGASGRRTLRHALSRGSADDGASSMGPSASVSVSADADSMDEDDEDGDAETNSGTGGGSGGGGSNSYGYSYNHSYSYSNSNSNSSRTPGGAATPTATATTTTGGPSIYHMLLSLYLTPPSPHKQQLGPALDLLSRHGARLPASSTLRLIPEGLPVAELAAYFRGRMRATHSAVHDSRIDRGLRQTGVLAAQAALLLGTDGSGRAGRSRHVVVGEERVCGVCHKRLGGSVVAVLPDNAVVHYGCLNRAAGKAWGRG